MKSFNTTTFILERDNLYCEYFVDRLHEADLVWSDKYSIKVRVSPIVSEYLDFGGGVVIRDFIFCIKDYTGCIDDYEEFYYYMDSYYSSLGGEVDYSEGVNDFIFNDRSEMFRTLFYDLFEDIILLRDGYFLDDFEGEVYNDCYEVVIEKIL